jgi:hypothetical protein
LGAEIYSQDGDASVTKASTLRKACLPRQGMRFQAYVKLIEEEKTGLRFFASGCCYYSTSILKALFYFTFFWERRIRSFWKNRRRSLLLVAAAYVCVVPLHFTLIYFTFFWERRIRFFLSHSVSPTC